MQRINLCKWRQQTLNVSMWQTLLKITYEGFSLEEEDTDYYKSEVIIFEKCLEGNISEFLKDQVSGQVPGTE